MKDINTIIMTFIFWYPLVMSMIWITGAILFYTKHERGEALPLVETPFVSILVPCYNEEETIEETIVCLGELDYPGYEVIAINDGSSDNTIEKLKELSLSCSYLRIIDLKKNAGKANALHLGLLASKGEILVTMDADALLDKDALRYIVPHFTLPNLGERVGAVTGNPRIRNRSTLLSRIQVCEFSSIIGLIKRCQRVLGKVMTVSGVIAAFRKKALLDCGLWDRDMITDDIAVTWKLQRRFWDVRYEPRAICWMLVPETLAGLWKQRVRWAQGGLEVMLRHWDIIFDWKQRRLIPVLMEQVLSVTWAICWTLTTILFFATSIITKNFMVPVFWSGAYLSLICIFQFLVAILIDSRYDEGLLKYYTWAVWYPVLYWYFNAFIIIRAIPKALLRNKNNKYAVWESPDRGIHYDS